MEQVNNLLRAAPPTRREFEFSLSRLTPGQGTAREVVPRGFLPFLQSCKTNKLSIKKDLYYWDFLIPQ
jgi:hypothetical protein